MEGALAGVRVIEFANYVSGPYAGMLLGDLGADVIKVEEPTRGDPFRGWGRVDYSPTFASVNRNKKSVTIDLKSEAGKADARALVKDADVVIDNFRPGTLERLGLGYAELSAGNERLVWCSITGFGTDGPYAHRPGYDTVGQAMSGLLSLLTDPANPQPMGISLSDHLAGVTACNGILAALIARGRTGRGQRVDTSLLESAISFCGENMARYFDNGKVPFRATRTKQAQVYAFASGDGKALVVHLSSPTKFWRSLCEVVGRTQWLDDPRFESKESRGKNYDDLHKGLQEVIATKPRAYWLERLEAADVPCSPLNTFDDVFDDPQVKHLGMRIETPHPKLGSISLVRNGLRMSDTPVQTHRGPPELGEHNDEVLPSMRSK